MVNSEEQRDSTVDDVTRDGQSNGGDLIDVTSSSSSSSAVTVGGSSSSSLSESVGGMVVEDVDEDLLLLQRNEDNVLQWLLALDMQVVGACRADERLKPLLKLNISTGAAEDRLLAHLSQHFEPAEIGMLARYLCIPLVSVRVGKVHKQRNLLCPTDKRGNLNLILLPTSDLRISFVGDDGHTERLTTLSCDSECSTVEIEGISADKSGRSFLLKSGEREVFYFWCSEKSKLLGSELLRKMKDLLKRKPSLAELSGISESRLDCFGIHLRAYLAGSSVTNGPSLAAPSSLLDSSLDSHGSNDLSTIVSPEPSRLQQNATQDLESSSTLNLVPINSSSSQEGMPRNFSSLQNVAREELRHHGENFVSCSDNMTFALSSNSDLTSSSFSEKDKPSEASGSCLFPPLTSLESFTRLADPSLLHPPTQVFSSSCPPAFSPYYCLCPPATATLPYTKPISQLPVSSAESFSLPSLSSLLSSARSSSLLSSTRPLGGGDFPSLDFPPLIPDPLVVRSQLAMPSSQQIPTFTPLMCDSIVHIPVIDVCSSGQGFFVSAGPAISTTIPPLHHSNLMSPLTPEAESVVEKGARETLRWLISGSSNQPNSLLDVLPSLIINGGDQKHNILATGSRGLYIGTTDVIAFTNGVAAMGLDRLSEGPVGNGVQGFCSDEFVHLPEESTGSGGSALNDGPSNVREERTE